MFVVPQSALAEEERKRLRNGINTLQQNDDITESAMTSDLKDRASSTADSSTAEAAKAAGTQSTARSSSAPEVVAADALRTAALQVTNSVLRAYPRRPLQYTRKHPVKGLATYT